MRNQNKAREEDFTDSLSNSKDKHFFVKNGGVTKCKTNLSQYFHPENSTLKKRFETIYKIFKLNDDKIASAVGIDRTTMNRYRRGIFIPTGKIKLLIAQKISELASYHVDSSVIWGDDLFFKEWRKDKK